MRNQSSFRRRTEKLWLGCTMFILISWIQTPLPHFPAPSPCFLSISPTDLDRLQERPVCVFLGQRQFSDESDICRQNCYCAFHFTTFVFKNKPHSAIRQRNYTQKPELKQEKKYIRHDNINLQSIHKQSVVSTGEPLLCCPTPDT